MVRMQREKIARNIYFHQLCQTRKTFGNATKLGLLSLLVYRGSLSLQLMSQCNYSVVSYFG